MRGEDGKKKKASGVWSEIIIRRQCRPIFCARVPRCRVRRVCVCVTLYYTVVVTLFHPQPPTPVRLYTNIIRTGLRRDGGGE